LPEQDVGPYFSDTDPDFNGEMQPIAVLLGSATASSGEMVAIAFHGRPHTRSFGMATMGATTAVHGAQDQYGNFFGITSLYAADRHGLRIHPKVVPDVVIEAKPAPTDQADQPLRAAIDWLRGQ
jgi:C-terminal processing protease CtpA/Prc